MLCTCFNVDSGTCTLLTGECIYILNACGCIKPGMCPWRCASSSPERAPPSVLGTVLYPTLVFSVSWLISVMGCAHAVT